MLSEIINMLSKAKIEDLRRIVRMMNKSEPMRGQPPVDSGPNID